MTTEDLRIQKGLAMVEVEECEKDLRTAEDAYDRTVAAVHHALEVLEGPITFNDLSALRRELQPYAEVVNLDALLASFGKRMDAQSALEAARQKLAVFRS